MQINKNYFKLATIFFPIFLIVYGNQNAYGLHALNLYENPFSTLNSEQWVQESPIQFFIGYFINFFVSNTLYTHWIVVILGFIYFFISTICFDHLYYKNYSILKIFYFTPLFLIFFSWMGKPDPFTVGSVLLLVAFNSNKFLSFTFTLLMVFSHPQIALIHFILLKFLKIYEFKTPHYISIVFSYLTYYFYFIQLEPFEGRYDVISQELDRVFKTIFTNSLAGLISLFMWLWVIIFFSKVYLNKRFFISFFIIFSVSFFTLDHTRIFIQLSIPLIIYLSNNHEFNRVFYKFFDNRSMYILGLFQLQKRGDGRIVDGINYYEIEFFRVFLNNILNLINKLPFI